MLDVAHLRKHTYTWLISGVAGFIGSNLMEYLLSMDQQVVGIDNFYTGNSDNIDSVLTRLPSHQRERFKFFEGDICSLALCQQAMDTVDFVLHQAALSSIPKSIEQVRLTHEININGFYNMLEAAKDAKIKRFIYASSCAIYGNKNGLPNQESQAVDILSPYNATKYINEIYASTFSTCYGLETIGLRYFNIYGPRQEAHGPYAAVITRWIDELRHNKPTYIHDEHHQTRDFCYVADVVQANILAALTTNPHALNTVYNIATGKECDLRYVYDLLIKALHIAPQEPVSQKTGQGELEHSRADITKARELLGFNPQFDIETGIQHLVRYMLDTAC